MMDLSYQFKVQGISIMDGFVPIDDYLLDEYINLYQILDSANDYNG